MADNLRVDVEGGVATLTLNRPGVGNGLDIPLAGALLDAARRCAADPGVRAVILTGAGKNFCFGGDLGGMSAQGGEVGSYLSEITTYLHASISAFARMRAPVVAAVNGTAAGAGVGLMCMADLAIAGHSSKFTLAYTGVALAPDGSTTFLLPRIVGRRRAMELFLTNRVLTSDEALEWGLVNEIVSDDEVLVRARELAGQLAAGPTGSYAAVKQLMAASEPGLESQMALEGNTIAAQGMTQEGREGIAAFLEKRKPKFS